MELKAKAPLVKPHELGDYFLVFVCLGDLIDLAQLNNKKLNRRVKDEETSGI